MNTIVMFNIIYEVIFMIYSLKWKAVQIRYKKICCTSIYWTIEKVKREQKLLTAQSSHDYIFKTFVLQKQKRKELFAHLYLIRLVPRNHFSNFLSKHVPINRITISWKFKKPSTKRSNVIGNTLSILSFSFVLQTCFSEI